MLSAALAGKKGDLPGNSWQLQIPAGCISHRQGQAVMCAIAQPHPQVPAMNSVDTKKWRGDMGQPHNMLLLLHV
jgi:hypothetical protein